MDESPHRIGDYILRRRLASGSIEAELFEAHHIDDPRTAVCIKRVHPSYADNPAFAERFERELSLAKKLRHRNLVEVSDYGEDDGHYLVMEFIDGPSLESLLLAVLLRPGLVTYIGVEVCRGFAYLHHSDPSEGRGPIIHSDVSPSNVVLDRVTGAVKLADFGVAKALGRTGAETITRARGKPTYMAPEQFTNDKVSTRTDLFSLGLVLWCALVGRHPYAEGRPRSETNVAQWIADRTVANERRTVAQAAPHAPPALCAAIEGLLQPVTTRTPSAEEAFRALAFTEPLDGHAQLVERIAEAEA